MLNTRLIYLLQAYRTGTLTVDEREELLSFIAADAQGAQTIPVLESLLEAGHGDAEPIDPARWQPILEGIITVDKVEALPSVPAVRRLRTGKKWWAAAAVIILLAGIAAAIAIVGINTGKSKQSDIAYQANDVGSPQTNRAVITLSSGQKVFLDSVANGQLAMQSNIKLIKTGDGQIAYNGSGTEQLIYNTLTNPRGSRVIYITLSDGSKVWLNAGSSITYPVAFTGKERQLTMTGEAYFEVAHDPSKPFVVNHREMDIKVLGTHFNVNAYDDEDAVRVTLLEGSVKVSELKTKNFKTITPGQQAELNSGSQLSVHNDVDLDQVMAWKNGKFRFNDAGIEEVMKEVQRWYDVEVEIKEKSGKLFRGGMSRNLSAANVFKILEETGGVHFQINGRKIIVTK